ncbi:MAG TPA: hypothetical protein VF862_02730 [Gemmatimonadales bacterium]
MLHRLYIDRLLVVSYIGLVGLLGCGGAPGPVIPLGATPAPVGEAEAWTAERRMEPPVLHRFRWLYRDRSQSLGGRGSARIADGDSLRFDISGPLGSGRGAAFVVGDSALWAEPEEDVRKLVPNYPLLWAMLGVARMPGAVTEAARYQDAKLTAWRLVSGADTVEFARIAGPPLKLVAEVRLGGERIGRVETVFAEDGAIKSSRLDIPRAPARLDLTYVSSSRTQPFASDIWVRPEP